MGTIPLKIFYCYAHADRELRQELQKHLRSLELDGLITTWCDQEITAGQNWEKAILKNLADADIVIPLVSPDFINSDYCQSIEMTQALDRQASGNVEIIPVILRPSDWEHRELGKLQALPAGGTPITKWPNRDEAFLDVAKGIRLKIEKQTKGSSRLQPAAVSAHHLNRSSSGWLVKSTALGALALATVGGVFLANRKATNVTQETVQQIGKNNPDGRSTPPPPVVVKTPVKKYKISVVLDQGADYPVFSLNGSPANAVSFQSGVATFRLTEGTYKLQAKYQNPNETCIATLSVPSEGLNTAICNPN